MTDKVKTYKYEFVSHNDSDFFLCILEEVKRALSGAQEVNFHTEIDANIEDAVKQTFTLTVKGLFKLPRLQDDDKVVK